jgi:hypothetical protein
MAVLVANVVASIAPAKVNRILIPLTPIANVPGLASIHRSVAHFARLQSQGVRCPATRRSADDTTKSKSRAASSTRGVHPSPCPGLRGSFV